jgi:hypothetical protein
MNSSWVKPAARNVRKASAISWADPVIAVPNMPVYSADDSGATTTPAERPIEAGLRPTSSSGLHTGIEADLVGAQRHRADLAPADSRGSWLDRHVASTTPISNVRVESSIELRDDCESTRERTRPGGRPSGADATRRPAVRSRSARRVPTRSDPRGRRARRSRRPEPRGRAPPREAAQGRGAVPG